MRKYLEVGCYFAMVALAVYTIARGITNQKCFKDEGVDVIYWRWDTSQRLCGIAYMQSFTLGEWEAHVEAGGGVSGLGSKEEAAKFIESYCPTK